MRAQTIIETNNKNRRSKTCERKGDHRYCCLQSAASLNNLAILYRDQGKYARAEPLCLRGAQIMEARFGKEHPSLATALNPYIGYAKAAEIVKESVATGVSIIEIARAKKLLSEEEIAEILDPVRMTEPQYPLESAKERDKAVTA